MVVFFSPPSPPELQPALSSVESSPPQPEKLNLEDLTGDSSGVLKCTSLYVVFNELVIKKLNIISYRIYNELI